MVICLERGADLHMAQLMLLPLTVSCFSKIQIGFTFLVPAHLGRPGQRAVKRACVCVCTFISLQCNAYMMCIFKALCKITEFQWTFPALTGILSLAYFIHNAVISIVRNQQNPQNNVSIKNTYTCDRLQHCICLTLLIDCSIA